mmetsp:Transcript_46358/g.117392  ORF Transcript_46358/g.117392 Transcript_46358/m.117392 type:complete len:306 (+) Transcript_46358:996-1913(+)
MTPAASAAAAICSSVTGRLACSVSSSQISSELSHVDIQSAPTCPRYQPGSPSGLGGVEKGGAVVVVGMTGGVVVTSVGGAGVVVGGRVVAGPVVGGAVVSPPPGDALHQQKRCAPVNWTPQAGSPVAPRPLKKQISLNSSETTALPLNVPHDTPSSPATAATSASEVGCMSAAATSSQLRPTARQVAAQSTLSSARNQPDAPGNDGEVGTGSVVAVVGSGVVVGSTGVCGVVVASDGVGDGVGAAVGAGVGLTVLGAGVGDVVGTDVGDVVGADPASEHRQKRCTPLKNAAQVSPGGAPIPGPGK